MKRVKSAYNGFFKLIQPNKKPTRLIEAEIRDKMVLAAFVDSIISVRIQTSFDYFSTLSNSNIVSISVVG